MSQGAVKVQVELSCDAVQELIDRIRRDHTIILRFKTELMRIRLALKEPSWRSSPDHELAIAVADQLARNIDRILAATAPIVRPGSLNSSGSVAYETR